MRRASCGGAAAGVRPPRKRKRPVETGRGVMKIDGKTIGCVSVRRSARRGSGGKTESHGGERTIVVWHGRPNVCVCDFRPAWLSPFSQGDEFFVSPPFQTNSKAICYSVSGKKLKNFVGTGRRNRGVRNKAGRAGFPTLPESSISFYVTNRQRLRTCSIQVSRSRGTKRRRKRSLHRVTGVLAALAAAVTSVTHVSATSPKVMAKAVPAVAPAPVPAAVNRLAGCDRRDD
jgi:hypothetical protein